MSKSYEPWPLGKLPDNLRRPEIAELEKILGRPLSDAREAITIFERTIASYAGSKYAVAVDCCSNAMFLCLKYLKAEGEVIEFPARTYCSAPMAAIHAGCHVRLVDKPWSGAYQLSPTPVWDSAVRFTQGMYQPGTLWCLSFQIKKRLPIGKGGMVLTDSREAADWIRAACYDGRHLDIDLDDDQFEMIGWHMYMTPEDAARGMKLFLQVPTINADDCTELDYHDLRLKTVFKDKGRNQYFDFGRLKYMGEGVRIGQSVRIRHPERVSIDDGTIIDDFAYISCGATIGKNCHISAHSTISGGDAHFYMGDRSTLSSHCSVHCSSSDYRKKSMDLPSVPEEQRYGGRTEDVTIGKEVVVGAHSCILPGAILPDGSAFGAYSLIKLRYREGGHYRKDHLYGYNTKLDELGRRE
jgi:acetyltransferase-like isoleucine patch superfamily enzyme